MSLINDVESLDHKPSRMTDLSLFSIKTELSDDGMYRWKLNDDAPIHYGQPLGIYNIHDRMFNYPTASMVIVKISLPELDYIFRFNESETKSPDAHVIIDDDLISRISSDNPMNFIYINGIPNAITINTSVSVSYFTVEII